MDLSRLTTNEGNRAYLTLSSPVNRTETKWEAFTTYQYHVDADSELGSILEPGKRYTIRFASQDLGVK